MLSSPILPSIGNIFLLTLPLILAQADLTPEQIQQLEDFQRNQPILNLASLISYLIIAYFSWTIFKKLNVQNAWFAWIPILGFYITLVAGNNEKPVLWTILAFIPCINIISLIQFVGAWVNICNGIGKSPWLLILCIFPCINFLVFAYFAFG